MFARKKTSSDGLLLLKKQFPALSYEGESFGVSPMLYFTDEMRQTEPQDASQLGILMVSSLLADQYGSQHPINDLEGAVIVPEGGVMWGFRMKTNRQRCYMSAEQTFAGLRHNISKLDKKACEASLLATASMYRSVRGLADAYAAAHNGEQSPHIDAESVGLYEAIALAFQAAAEQMVRDPDPNTEEAAREFIRNMTEAKKKWAVS